MNLKGGSMRIAGIFLGLSVLWAVAAGAAEERIALFDGKTLKGWTVLKCEAEVDSGEILIKAGNGLVQTEQKYGDFVLELDWKNLKQDKYDSGIYFRYDETMMSEKSAWPPRYQSNLRQGDEGNVAGVKGAKPRPDLVKPGEWNHFKLTVRGAKAELEINGKPAWKGEGLAGPKEGFIALQAEVPGGGQFRFRNIYLAK
ncbi:MAG: DUF1080 domain-containing protein [Planctomycetota bacterium]|nr:DUF1080 domain-containing protein [Planctomycetota bacterium]